MVAVMPVSTYPFPVSLLVRSVRIRKSRIEVIQVEPNPSPVTKPNFPTYPQPTTTTAAPSTKSTSNTYTTNHTI